MASSILPRNEHHVERAIRVLLGLVLLSGRLRAALADEVPTDVVARLKTRMRRVVLEG